MSRLFHASLLVASSVASGCTHDSLAISMRDASAPADLAPTSGSRLKVGHYQAVDGASGAFFWRDSALDVTCSWLPGPDGRYRCAPGASASLSDIVFADPQCARAALSWSATEPLSAITRTVSTTCPPSFAVRLVGPKLDQRVYYQRDERSGACYPEGVALAPGDALYALADEAPTALVSAVRRLGEAAGGVAPVFLDADDGSSLFLSWHDVARGLDCSAGTGADGQPHCLPRASAYFAAEAGIFADQLCGKEAASGTRSSCAPQTVILARLGSGCAARTQLYAAAMRLERGYLRGASSCNSIGSPAQDYFTAGAEIPATSLPAIAAGVLGEGRLQTKTERTSAGTVATNIFWDSQLGMDCGPLRTTDGLVRCVGFPRLLTSGARQFADPQCTRPVLDREAGWCSESIVGFSVPGAVASSYHLFRGQGLHAGPLYRKGTEGCVATPRSNESSYFLLGDELPPSVFAELERVP
jgi:hypothetical protein